MTTREDIINILKENKSVKITFTKVDGGQRVLEGTLHSDVLPPVQNLEGGVKKERVQNPDIIKVWDITNAGWRSFRLDNLISYTI